MSDLLPLPLTITIPTLHQKLLREVRATRHSVLSFDPVRRTLTTWYWSVPKAGRPPYTVRQLTFLTGHLTAKTFNAYRLVS